MYLIADKDFTASDRRTAASSSFTPPRTPRQTPPLRPNVNVLLSNVTFLMIFAVSGLSPLTLRINCSFSID